MEIAYKLKLPDYFLNVFKQEFVNLNNFDLDSNGINIAYRSEFGLALGTEVVDDEEFSKLVHSWLNKEIIALVVYADIDKGTSISVIPMENWHFAGLVYITKEDAMINSDSQNFNEKVKKQAYQDLNQFVTMFNDLLTGNVWAYQLINKSGEIVDSSYGFIGDPNVCLSVGLDEYAEIIYNEYDS